MRSWGGEVGVERFGYLESEAHGRCGGIEQERPPKIET